MFFKFIFSALKSNFTKERKMYEHISCTIIYVYEYLCVFNYVYTYLYILYIYTFMYKKCFSRQLKNIFKIYTEVSLNIKIQRRSY